MHSATNAVSVDQPPVPRAHRSRGSVLGRADAVLLVGLAASLTASCVLASARKYLWYDELFSRGLLLDPSLRHMLAVMIQGGEAAPPLYHVLGRFWVAVFGTSTVSLRLFSSVGLAAAAGVLWYTLRRSFSLKATALAVYCVFTLSWVLLWQNAETRFYGVFLLTATLALLTTSILMQRLGVSGRLLIANAMAHTALVWSHYFGLLYSGALFAALLVADWRRHTLRPAVYASVAVAWLTFLLWLVPLVNQARVASTSWVASPTYKDLLDLYQFSMPWLPHVILAAILLSALERALAVWPRAPQADTDPPQPPDQSAAVIAATLLFAVPLIPFIVSRMWQSVFLDRYMLPSLMGWAVVLAFLVDSASPYQPAGRTGGFAATRLAGRGQRAVRGLAAVAWVALLGALLAHPLFYAIRVMGAPPFAVHPWHDIEQARLRGAPLHKLPVAVESAIAWLPLVHYSTHSDMPVFYILDRESALDPRSDKSAAIHYSYLSWARRRGYITRNLVSSAEFLCSYDRFLVLDDPRLYWYERHVRNDSSFSSQVVGRYNDRDTLRVVERTHPLSTLRCANPEPPAR